VSRTVAKALIVIAGLGLGCKPDLGAPPSLVTEPTILAVRGRITEAGTDATVSAESFAEADPGEQVVYDLLVAGPGGTITDARAVFTVCLQPKPPAESNSVSAACVSAPPEGEATTTAEITLPGPGDACSLFGPNAPDPSKTGGIALRPRDPDSTGGFYVPVRALITGAPADLEAFALTRLRCRPGGASAAVLGKWSNEVTGYHKNHAPLLAGLQLIAPDGTRTPLTDAQPRPSVRSGATVMLEAPLAAEASEDYIWVDPTRGELAPRRESLSLSWFTTAGEFTSDRTGRTETETTVVSTNAWTAPVVAATTTVHLWLVLRDSRGGTDFAAFAVDVTP
jgi:hypothetical protein